MMRGPFFLKSDEVPRVNFVDTTAQKVTRALREQNELHATFSPQCFDFFESFY